MAKEFIAIDVETTGLDPREHKICEFGAVKFNDAGEILDKLDLLVDPGRMIPFPALKIHGIKNEMVEGAPTPKEGWTKLLEWCGDTSVLVAHNASFESYFIQALYDDNEVKPELSIIDTLKIAKRQFKNESSYKLSDLIPSLGSKAHRALPDAEACVELFLQLSETYKSGKIPDSNAKDIWAFDYIEENKPSYKQLNYIETLGGDSDQPKTKAEASEYIDELKDLQGQQSKKQVDDSSGGSGLVMFIAIISTIFVVAYFVA